jgi:hypothetical protein
MSLKVQGEIVDNFKNFEITALDGSVFTFEA